MLNKFITKRISARKKLLYFINMFKLVKIKVTYGFLLKIELQNSL